LRSVREKADSEMNKGNVAEAVQLYERWLEVMPRDAECAILIAKCRFKLNEKESGYSALERAAKLGYARADLVSSDSVFAKLNGQKRYDIALSSMKKNAAENEVSPFRYVPQTRMGRYRIFYPVNYTTDKRYSLIVMLHGNGNDPSLMLKLAQQMKIENAIIISPEAPYLKFRESAYSLTEKFSATGEDRNFPDTLRDEVIDLSAQWYDSIIDDAFSFLPLKKALPLLIGFSQGGFYASVMGTRYPHRYSGIVTICASLYPEGRVVENIKYIYKYGVPVLVLHSTNDPVVPYQTGELFASALKTEKVNCEFFSYMGGHWLNDEAFAKLKEWVYNHLQK